MSVGNLKYFNSFHILHRLVKIWVFQASYLSFEVLKLINSCHSLNRFVKIWVFQASYLSFEVLKLIDSFHSLNRFVKVWVFQASYLSFDVLKLINSCHSLNRFVKNWVFRVSYLSFEVLTLINSFQRLNQFAKKLRFLNKLFQLWRFSVFPSGFIDEIDSRFFFHANYASFKKIGKNQFSFVLNQFAKNFSFLNKQFELWKYELFQFSSWL